MLLWNPKQGDPSGLASLWTVNRSKLGTTDWLKVGEYDDLSWLRMPMGEKFIGGGKSDLF